MKVNKRIHLIFQRVITQDSETIVLVRTSTIYLDQTIHTSQGKQGLQTTAIIPLDQAIVPTALEARVAQEGQVDRRLGHLVAAEDNINN
tara:strand:- start:707 stop:973 length:267 start_codon:yes stop_codon:yes gene_type:complete